MTLIRKTADQGDFGQRSFAVSQQVGGVLHPRLRISSPIVQRLYL